MINSKKILNREEKNKIVFTTKTKTAREDMRPFSSALYDTKFTKSK